MSISSTRLISATAVALIGMLCAQGAAQADDAKTVPAKIDRTAGPVRLIYPKDAQVRGEEGSVDIVLQINASGRPTGRYKFAKSSGSPDLDNAALQSMLNWHYTAARKADGETTSWWLPLHVEYKLPKQPAADEAGKSD